MRQAVSDKRLKIMKSRFKLLGPKSGRGRLQEMIVY